VNSNPSILKPLNTAGSYTMYSTSGPVFSRKSYSFWRQIILILEANQTHSHANAVGRKGGICPSDRSQNAPARRKKANKASKPRYRQGKTGGKVKSFYTKETAPPILILSKRPGRGSSPICYPVCACLNLEPLTSHLNSLTLVFYP
jgi:hypothetical protein